MFVRKKKNRSGSTSVVVVDKSRGRFHELKTIGVSSNEVFKLAGFDAIDDDILKHLVIARLCQPTSKAGTVDYLKSYFDEDVELNRIYRYLDRLYNRQQEKIQQISVEHT